MPNPDTIALQPSNLAKTIDALGELKAQIASLQDMEKAMKEALGELEPGAYDGHKFRLSVSVSDRETLDMDAVREKLSPQFIRAHTNTTSIRALRVTARKTS
jgi:hypothetical protein